MAGGWKAIIVMAHPCEEATMDRQLTVTARIDGAHLSKLIHKMTESRPGLCLPSNSSPEAGIEMPLQANFSCVCYSLLKVFAWPDDDRCMSGLNRDAVDPSEARPDPTITCSWIFCFDCLSTACHCAYCRRPRLHRTPAMTAKIVAGSRGCRFRIFLSAASSLPICTDMWIVSS